MSDDTTDGAEQSSDDDPDASVETNLFEEIDATAEPTATDDDPLAALDASDEEPLDDVFEAMDSDAPFDDSDVFERLGEAETAESEPNVIELQEVEAVEKGAIVPKSQYYEQCEHFSEPPATRCKNDGTTIHELTDLDHVRVTSCPIVRERTEMTSTGGD